MNYLVQFIVSFIAIVGFAILFNAPKMEIAFCGITGGVGWIVYFLLTEAGTGKVFASFVASLALTILARAFAVIREYPGTVYLLTGIFCLVPGAGIYYTAYYVFLHDAQAATEALMTFEIAGAIVLGIVMGSAIPQGVFSRLKKK